jgi:ankyrin repeat protein
MRCSLQIKLESTPEREQALFDLASTSNITALANLLNIGTDPNAIATDGTKRTPLHVAAQSGNAGVVLHLLLAGAQLNVQDALGMTPLHYAAQYDEQTTRLLIERGADVNAAGPGKITPLHSAAQKGLASCVRTLIEAGARVSPAQSANLSTPLHLAASAGNATACEVLVAAGAKVHHFDLHDRTSLHCAAIGGHLDACKVLVAAGGNPDFMKHEVLGRSSFRSPLQEAVNFKHENVVEYFLLTCMANYQLTSRGGETLRDLAKGRPAIVRILRALESQAMLGDAVVAAFDEVAPAPTASRGLSPL